MAVRVVICMAEPKSPKARDGQGPKKSASSKQPTRNSSRDAAQGKKPTTMRKADVANGENPDE